VEIDHLAELLSAPNQPGLKQQEPTMREIEVLQLISLGLANREIANLKGAKTPIPGFGALHPSMSSHTPPRMTALSGFAVTSRLAPHCGCRDVGM
jgi:hypothetical protein